MKARSLCADSGGSGWLIVCRLMWVWSAVLSILISSVEKERQSELGNLADHGNLFQLVKAVEVC